MKIKHWIVGLLTLLTLTMPVFSVEASSLDSIRAEEATKQDELYTLESEINQALDEINRIHAELLNLEDAIEETERSIEETQEDIAVKEEEVQKRNEVMKENLRNLQTSEMNHSMIISILNSESLSEMFNRAQVLATLQSANSESFENAQHENNELLALKEKNESEKEKLVNDKARVEDQEAVMTKKVAALNTKLEDNKEQLKVLATRKADEELRIQEEAEKIERMHARALEEKEVVQLAEAKQDEDAKKTVIDTSAPESPKPAKMNHTAPKTTVKKAVQPKAEVKTVSQPEPQAQPKSEPAPQAPTESKPAPKPQSNGKTMTVVASAYSTNQPNLSSHTATGIDLRSNPNVIAVDPSVIPLGSTVEIQGYGVFTAGDTGGAIKGNRIDIHMLNLGAAQSFGYQTLNIKILN